MVIDVSGMYYGGKAGNNKSDITLSGVWKSG